MLQLDLGFFNVITISIIIVIFGQVFKLLSMNGLVKIIPAKHYFTGPTIK